MRHANLPHPDAALWRQQPVRCSGWLFIAVSPHAPHALCVQARQAGLRTFILGRSLLLASTSHVRQPRVPLHLLSCSGG